VAVPRENLPSCLYHRAVGPFFTALTNCKGSVFPHRAKGNFPLRCPFLGKSAPPCGGSIFHRTNWYALTKGSVFPHGDAMAWSSFALYFPREICPTVRWVHFSPRYELTKGSVFLTGKQRRGSAKGNLPSCCTRSTLPAACGGSIFHHTTCYLPPR
jgi:hypothetical protein